MNPYASGALAGIVATAPMTAAILLLHRYLPGVDRAPLPPAHITAELAEKAGVYQEMDKEEHVLATTIGHFGYGGASGLLYAPLAGTLPGHPAFKGALFGLAVWLVSYLGWLPVAGIMRSATQQPARRNTIMIVAHLLWGAVTGLLTESWSKNAGTKAPDTTG